MLDTENYMPRLRADYDDRIKAAMIEEFGYKNEMMVPRLDKIVLNIGCGAEAVKDRQSNEEPEQRGKIAGVIRPGYQYFISEENIKVVRPAQVRLFG